MVVNIISGMSLTGSGFRDWLAQRISAVILALYVILILGFIYLHPHTHFSMIKNFFALTWMKVFTLLALLSLFIHAWIGIWTVITDYVKASWQFFISLLVIMSLVVYLFWGVAILFTFS